MNLNKFDQPLKIYLEAITLSKTQETQINFALEGVLSLALTAFPDAIVYAQGSFATDTMAKPLTAKQGGGKAGEFDIDVAIESEAWGYAVDSLDETATAIEGDDTFGELIIDKTKNSCIRIEYPEDKTGVAFHIDLVPTKLENGSRSVPDRDNSDWKPSDAKQFAEWFNDKAAAQPGIRQVAIILKRLRDLAGLTDEIKSILVLTLVMQAYYDSGSIMGDLVSVLDGIVVILADADKTPCIENPVNTGENLAEHLTDYSAVRSLFLDTKQKLMSALSDDDASGLKDIFGPGFDYTTDTKRNYATAATAIVAPVGAFGVADGETDG